MRISLAGFISSSLLKVSSGILGFLLWSLMSGSRYHEVTLTVPICLYNMPDQALNQAPVLEPEQITVTLGGTRSHLQDLMHEELGLHINYATLTIGQTLVQPTQHQLLLPADIKLVSYKPLYATIIKQEVS